ncbi:hypothetical protein OG339_22340 [Streptosporangium sp. NBC_01495]|uniref:hypothetical protein n=1 Tax=Streptosporangium sp. NBC_01495 TaxID=2903899 RepID=UPI002E309C15|nr:hypothetical protein [Streptosporangium sp. NBC_01495]
MTSAAPTQLRKPYVTSYAEENLDLPLAFEWVDGMSRLTYRDALPLEWMFGVLWARCGTAREGRIQWNLVHTLRQRRCMMQGLCRVCGKSAIDPDTGRISWILTSALAGDFRSPWPTAHPPTCKAHVAEALTACPKLRREPPVVCTVSDYTPVAVLVNLYGADDGGRVVEIRHQIPVNLNDRHLLKQALATQLIVRLEDLQPVQG